jgi:hypothetical protein
MSDGDAMHKVNKIVFALHPPGPAGWAGIDANISGPDPDFKFMAQARMSNVVTPVQINAPLSLEVLVPTGFCNSAVKLSVKDITEEIVKEAEKEIAGMDLKDLGEKDAIRRLTGVEASKVSKNLAVRVLKKMHSTHEMFMAYKQEKQRLVRTAFIEYSVMAVLALAVLFSAGAVVRHSLEARKWGAVGVNDEEVALA